MSKIPESIEQLMTTSGNNFHYKVVDFFRKEKWSVLVSPYYNDSYTDKPREIDIIAEKLYEIYDMGRYKGCINVRLFIECKYIPSDNQTVFWFDNKDMVKAFQSVKMNTPLTEPHYQKLHHYTSDSSEEVAKLFNSKNSNLPDIEKEIIYKALNQSISALIYNKNRQTNISGSNMLSVINYPLILCSSFNGFYKHSVISKNTSEIKDNFKLEVNYAYLDESKKTTSEYFLIDVVSLDNLKIFLDEIESKDIKGIREKLLW